MKRIIYIIVLVTVSVLVHDAHAQLRFPRPEFESGHQVADLVLSGGRSDVYEYVDAAVLLAAMILAAMLVLHRRRRRELFLLTLFCVIYFGFWRRGCICPVGSMQNVVLAITSPSYAIPWTVLVFFLLPLLFALFFGRVFCGSVCPLGGLQDLVIMRPVTVPRWLAETLGLFRYVYLGITVVFVVTGTGFIVCRLDPFVSLFRLSGTMVLLVAGAVFLVLGTVVARPYCRFVCPYGVLLGWMSGVSWRHATITPTDCVQCGLCEDSCPFGAILPPETPPPLAERRRDSRRLGVLIVGLPVLMMIGALGGLSVAGRVSRANRTVSLSEQISWEESQPSLLSLTTEESEAFRASGKPVSELKAQAKAIRLKFKIGMGVVGGVLGLIVGCKLMSLSMRRKRDGYEPDRANCLSCGRCFEYCPVEREQRTHRNGKAAPTKAEDG